MAGLFNGARTSVVDPGQEVAEITQLLVEGRDTLAKNRIAFLRDGMRQFAPAQQDALKQGLKELDRLAKLSQDRRAVAVRRASEGSEAPRNHRDTFTCRFCGQRQPWDLGVEAGTRRACQACASSVMCPRCHNRRPEGFDTCFRCRDDRSAGRGARPNPFRM